MLKRLLRGPADPALRKVAIALAGLILVYGVGTAGYMMMEGWTFTDASYMTIITVATVGYGEVHSLGPEGRWFTIALLLGGMGTLVYGATNLTAFVVEGDLRNLLRRSQMDKRIEKLSGHIILCGAGRVGRNIAEEICRMGQDIVVIDTDPEHLAYLEHLPCAPMFVVGNATDDHVLEQAGIAKASGFIAALATDSDNLYVVLSARHMNPGLRIVARVNEEEVTAKMLRAGANKAICPSHIGGLRMASELIRPDVVDFLDKMLREKEGKLRVSEAVVAEGGSLAGRTLSEAHIPKKTGCVVVALRRPSGDFAFNPQAHERLVAGDVLIVIGEVEQVNLLSKLAGRVEV